MPPAHASLTANTLVQQLGGTYAELPLAERTRHLRMLRTVAASAEPFLRTDPDGDGWRVTLVAPDAIGVLAIVCGLFTVHHLDIISAKVFSVEVPRAPVAMRPRPGMPGGPPQAPAPAPCALDVFTVRPLGGPPPRGLWPRFRRDLNLLMGMVNDGNARDAQDWVMDRFGRALRGMDLDSGMLAPVHISITNAPGQRHTRLELHSADVPGFLFAFTNALAGSSIDIRSASADTVNGQARDVFWVVNRDGMPVTSPAALQELRVVAALIKQFTHLLPRSPQPAQALRQFRALVGQILASPERVGDLTDLESPEVLQTLADLMGVSRFLWEDFLRLQHENLYPVVANVPALDTAPQRSALTAGMQQHLARFTSTSDRIAALNAFKDREMFRIDLRHITGRTPFSAFSEELTVLAEVAVHAAAELAHQMVQNTGRGTGPASFGDWPWCIAGLGKFGGREMGFGSDIELLVVYHPPTGEAAAGAHAYFERFVKAFQTVIHARQHGIFEIDLRLRPYGSAGALAVPMEAARAYYSPRGDAQQFERLALVKLRPVAGDQQLANELTALRDAFVYSGLPLDWSDIATLRDLQVAELAPPGEVNAKYSHGGLVDLEYFVQTRQILNGGQHPSVRTTNTLEAVDRLEAAGVIDPNLAAALRENYGFLRRLIDALRVVRGNAKDLNIPAASTEELTYLTHRLQFASPAAMQAAITARMAQAAQVWRH